MSETAPSVRSGSFPSPRQQDDRRAAQPRRPARAGAAWLQAPADPSLQRAVGVGRLLVLAGVGVLALVGQAGQEQPAATVGALALGTILAAGLAYARQVPSGLPAAAGLSDGLLLAALVHTSGGPASGLDVLLPAAVLALAAQPARRTIPLLALAILAAYAGAVLAHPAFAAGEHVGSLASRLLLGALLAAAAYLLAGQRAAADRARRQDELGVATTARKLADEQAALLAMVGHELRTPLTGVRGFAQLIARDRAAPATVRRYAELILAETDRTVRSLADVVDLAHLRVGRAALRRSTVSLAPVVASAAAALAHQDRDGRLQVSLPADLPTVDADPARLQRIMVNLIGGALRYSQGSGALVVSAASDAAGVTLWVEDCGGGLQLDRLAHVFGAGDDGHGDGGRGDAGDALAAPPGRPVAGDGARSASGGDGDEGEAEPDRADGALGGSGLGLYVTRRLVEAHGGRMWIERASGGATRLALSLRRPAVASGVKAP